LTRSEALPPLKGIQAALRKTSEALARELAFPGPNAPDWSASEWRIARAVAALHGVSSLLARRLQWRGPPGWEDFLCEQATHTAARHVRITELLDALDGRSRTAGVAFVPLKGAALYAGGLYEAGERPMADLDLLVAPGDLGPMTRTLEAAGFAQTAVTIKHHVFESSPRLDYAPFGEHSANPIKIELHLRIAELLPRRTVDVTDLIMPLPPRPGLNGYRSTASLMVHLLLHASGAMLFRALRLVQLHDIALLSARMAAEACDEVLAASGPQRGLWWALPPLKLVERYYRVIPARVLAAAGRRCPAALMRAAASQQLWEVSMSDMRRSAFAGIGWARSPGEALAYALERALLSARVLGQSALARAPTGLSESRPPPGATAVPRLRWMSLRPVRTATLNAVRHALAQPR